MRALSRLSGWLMLAGLCLAAAPGTAQPAGSATVRTPVNRGAAPRRALVIGVTSYQKTSSLERADDDARAFAEFLRTQWAFPADSVVVMTEDAPANLKPTLANVSEQISTLMNGVKKETEVVVYFSGHGVRDGREDWLVPSDGNPAEVVGTCVSADKLVNGLLEKKPKRALLFLDANRNLQKPSPQTETLAMRGVRSARGIELGVMYSCETGEASRAGKPKDFQHGVFTQYLLQGLAGDREAAGPDGAMTFEALRKYVRGKVRQYVNAEYSEYQSPYAITTSGAMVLPKAAAK